MEIKHCNMGYGQTKQLQRCLDCCSEPSVHHLLLPLPLSISACLFPFPRKALCLWVLASLPLHTGNMVDGVILSP